MILGLKLICCFCLFVAFPLGLVAVMDDLRPARPRKDLEDEKCGED